MDTLIYLEKQIKEQYKLHSDCRPFIVAIDGLGGAGKTTLVHRLKSIGKHVVIFHIDDHIVERRKRYDTGYDEWFEYYHLQWDVPYLKQVLFEALYHGKNSLCLPFYNKQKDEIEERVIDVPRHSIVLIEGIFLLRDEWRSFFDYIVFIDCPKEVRRKRVLQRDTYIGEVEERLKKYENRYWPAENYYVESQNPLQFAHYILRADDHL